MEVLGDTANSNMHLCKDANISLLSLMLIRKVGPCEIINYWTLPLISFTYIQCKRVLYAQNNSCFWNLLQKYNPTSLLGQSKKNLKGHWITSASSPDIFQKSWDFYTIRSVYLCSDCILNFTCYFNLITKICEFFLWLPFLKVYF